MKDNNCIFCKLANGDIPTNSIYEDDEFKVILDASPATKGHALILPKNHFANLLEADDDVLAKALPLAKKIGNKMMKELGCDGINIIQNNGEAAGQTVHHFHIHVIPRNAGDEAIKDWNHITVSDKDTEDVVSKLKM